jgi:prepilin-type N-terminal cleavage/methylation domain-containing protein
MAIIMLSPSRQFSFQPEGTRPARLRSGFTLTEIVIALAVLGTMAAGVYLGFNGINAYSVSSRLYSEALTAAQNHVDLVLSKGPFDKDAAYVSGTFNPLLNKVPLELMTTAELDALATTGSGSGPVNFPTTAPTPSSNSAYYPAYYPYYRTGMGQPIKKEAFIYQDPVSGTVVVRGTLTSTVVDPNITMDFLAAAPSFTPTPLNTRKANVTVTYNFRGRDYTLAMDTLRTADQ